MLNKQPFLLTVPFSCVSADRRAPREPEDDWHCSVRGNISVICISCDYRLWWCLSRVFCLLKCKLPKLPCTFIMRVKTHQAGAITRFFPPSAYHYLHTLCFFLFCKQKNVQWRGLGFNWDNECLLWKRSRWVECWKGALITAAAYPVIV